MKSVLFIFIIFQSYFTYAFVDNVKHGYPSCVACHISPSGGGVLNDYGRSLSKELMSTWGVSEDFAKPYFAFDNTKNLKLGGHVRSLQRYVKNASVDQGRLFLMQQNIELAYTVGPTSYVTTLGTQQGPEGAPNKGQFLSERH